ncbi:hypothetical protein N7495_002057 [Penicillium taxi]|uniref:uncharacterized protein n=1 Tax=Penicillium taxi TaxID=168475 RepID=UPI0025457D36|nr:uncharacterized protein N7495_002057 [Penicillium taxi]KAJ5901529.1 hypothetical protein N7495_002057 [Penicillium taxi]
MDTSSISQKSYSQAKEVPGNLFDAPEGSALIHACNSRGIWGSGIAKEFKERYPTAYGIYRNHCLGHIRNRTIHDVVNLKAENNNESDNLISVRRPVGTALIIPPQTLDRRYGGKGHWVICLFTSFDYGKRADPPDLIVNSTYAALHHLKIQLNTLEERNFYLEEATPGQLMACRFNSGLFGVFWERTRRLLEKVDLDVAVVY